MRGFQIERGFPERREKHLLVGLATDNSLRLTGLAAGRWPTGITQTFAALLNVSYESFKLHQSCTMALSLFFYFLSTFLSFFLDFYPLLERGYRGKLSSSLLFYRHLCFFLFHLDIDTFSSTLATAKRQKKDQPMIRDPSTISSQIP